MARRLARFLATITVLVGLSLLGWGIIAAAVVLLPWWLSFGALLVFVGAGLAAMVRDPK